MIIISTIINIILIVVSVLLFCLIVTIHEFGHFISAKLSGVRVNEFSVGMGPLLLKTQRGETQYSIRLLPIGGYCAMEGEDEQSDDPKAFGNKATWKRIVIVAMGAVFNIVLGFILMMIIMGQQPAFASTAVAQFDENATTAASGLMLGDEINSLNGYKVYSYNDFTFALGTDPAVTAAIKEGTRARVDMTVTRDGHRQNLHDVEFDTVDSGGKRILQIDFKVKGIPNNPLNLIKEAFNSTVSTVRMVWASLEGLIMGKFSFNDMAGPIGIASAMSQTASAGLAVGFLAALNNILYMMALITVNLGVFNLLPLPALDGGRLVFLLIELISRRKVPAKYERLVHAAGFALLLALMIVVSFSDVMRLITGSGIGG